MKNRQPAPVFDEFPSYKGGHTTLWTGYVFEFCPGHRLQNRWGWVAQHRLVAEDILGRPLHQDESKGHRLSEAVHHKDHVRTNNAPENLEIMTNIEHRRMHGRENAGKNLARLTEEMVRDALHLTKNIKSAAKFLHCEHMTLRRRFPDLVQPYKRKSPADFDDPQLIETVIRLAGNPGANTATISAETGLNPISVWRLCQKHNIPWTKRSKKGEKHKTYRGRDIRMTRKTAAAALRATGTMSGAAKALGHDVATLCSHFPDLVAPYQRKSSLKT